MRPLYELIESQNILGTKASMQQLISGISDDTRRLKPGDLFIAIDGKRDFGKRHLQAAFERGAAAAIVDSADCFSDNCILVRSPREALAYAASAFFNHPSRKLSLVGVTGTNGKTTTTQLLHSAWEDLGYAVGMIGTVEYRWPGHSEQASLTTPGALQLQELLARMVLCGTTHVAMEVSSIALDQFRTGYTFFKTAIFTNLTQDHLDYHGDFERYYAAKRALFTQHSMEFAVVNIDDRWGNRLASELPSHLRLITFGSRSACDVRPSGSHFSVKGIRTDVSVFGKTFLMESPLIGSHNLSNILAAMGAWHSLDLPIDRFIESISRKTNVPGRLERVAQAEDRPAIFVDYAHTPDALENVLTALRKLNDDANNGGRILTVFGCGGDRDKMKRSLMGKIASTLSDVIIATSDNPRTEKADAIIDDIERGVAKTSRYFRDADRATAIRLALSMARPNDIVLIAGKGHETYQILGSQRVAFDDRIVVHSYYRVG